MVIQGFLSASFTKIGHVVQSDTERQKHHCLPFSRGGVGGGVLKKLLQAKDTGLLVDLEPKQMWVLHLHGALAVFLQGLLPMV